MKFMGAVVIILFVANYAAGQSRWDYSWNYSTTMRYYSNKAALDKVIKGDREKPTGKEPYVMFPHQGKTTYDNEEEKVSTFKVQQIAIEALKGVDWTKYGAKTNIEVYQVREKATNELIEKIKGAIDFHNKWLTDNKLPVNDLAVTWAACIGFSKKVNDPTVNALTVIKEYRKRCSDQLTANGAVEKKNYDKSLDQIRLISIGIRPFVQFANAQKENSQFLREQAVDAARLFLENYAPAEK